MEKFGERWKNYTSRIKNNWNEKVKEDDIVLIPGDISWAINLKEIIEDIKFIENLPGIKIIGKGNHDYWWMTQSHLSRFIDENEIKTCKFLFNNSFKYENTIICGTRGWLLPTDDDFKDEDEKIFNRELGRLELSLKHGLLTYEEGDEIIVMLHYPPYSTDMEMSAMVDLLKKYKVSRCVFGHAHGNVCDRYFEGVLDGINYSLVSADHLRFNPTQLK